MMGGISRDAADGLVEAGGSDSLVLPFRDDAIKIDYLKRKHRFDLSLTALFSLPLEFGS